jgi:tetratricopeptide (TPR) repeat protein
VEAGADDDDISIYGAPPAFLRQLVEDNGGESAFKGMTTSGVKRAFIVPQTRATQLSLCAQLRQQRDARVQPATWFVSHAWQCEFLDLVSALEAFFADKPGAVMWLDLICTSQHSTVDRPPEWWQNTFCSAIGRMGQMVMVMTPWDNPVCLTRAWCLFELYACRSTGGHFAVAFPTTDRAQFLSQIADIGDAFYNMLSHVNTAKSECSRQLDKQRIFAAVRGLDGGFSALDRSVLNTMTEWLQLQLEQMEQRAALDALDFDSCRMQHALAILFEKKTEYDRAHVLFERCFETRQSLLGSDHADTLESQLCLAGSFLNIRNNGKALQLAEECLAKRTQMLGELHPDTLSSIFTVACVCIQNKQLDRAAALHQDCLSKRKVVLGDSHPKTLVSTANLAQLHLRTKALPRALELYDDCLLQSRLLHGDDHPHTLSFLSQLASCYRALAQHDRALALFEQCYAGECRVLGEEHEGTIVTLFNMANLFAETKQLRRALDLFSTCHSRSRIALGQGHPTTIMCEECIQRCQMQLAFARLSDSEKHMFS